MSAKFLEILKQRAKERLLESKEAQSYLLKRKLSRDVWERFDLGCIGNSPKVFDDGSRERENFIAKNSSAPGKEDLIKIRNRITIPIRDSRGASVGMLFRMIEDNPKYPKYNAYYTPDGHDYGALFGLFEAFDEIVRTDTVYISEGSVDAMALSLVVPNVVSSLTASVNSQQHDTLMDLCSRRVLLYDNDGPGRAGVQELMDRYPGKYTAKFLSFKDAGRGLEFFGIDRFREIVKRGLGLR